VAQPLEAQLLNELATRGLARFDPQAHRGTQRPYLPVLTLNQHVQTIKVSSDRAPDDLIERLSLTSIHEAEAIAGAGVQATPVNRSGSATSIDPWSRSLLASQTSLIPLILLRPRSRGSL
jgi:hypothetical protein